MNRRAASWAVAAALLGAAALFLLPLVIDPSGVPYAKGARFTDLLTAHLPSAWLLHRSVETWGTIPLWNPTILSGLPFAADPLSGLWYPPLWLPAIWPAPLTFNLLTWAHLVWAGFGMVRLGRRLGLSTLPSVLGAFAFMGAPKLVGHVGLGHVSLVMAVCWMPWVLVATQSVMGRLREGERGILGAAARLGGLLALVFLIDPRWAVPSAIVASSFAAVSWIVDRGPVGRDGGRGLAAAAVVIAFGVAGAAGLALPLLEWLGLSTRTGLAAAGSSLPLPAANLIGLVLPQFGASAEFIVSAGVVVLMLAVVALMERGRQAWLWGAFVVGGWVLALGDATPIGDGLSLIPGWNLMRVPPRWLFVSSLGLSVLCAFGAEAILRARAGRRLKRSSHLTSAAVMGSVVAMGVGIFLIRPPGSPVGFGLLLAPALAVSAFAVVSLSLRTPPNGTGLLLAGLVLVDLWGIDRTLLEARDPMREEPAAAATSPWIEAGIEGFRLFSPSYAIPQDEAARLGLELADGVHPLQLRAYVEWMARATGFEASAYGVTLPPFPTGDPKDDWGPRLDATSLGQLSVAYVVSDYPLDAPGWELAPTHGEVFAYRNPEVRPRAWIESWDGGWVAAHVEDRNPNRVLLEAVGPGRLVSSEIAYPGWRVWVDGQEAAIATVEGLLRGVDIESGRHEVRFEFRPTSVYLGLGLTIASLIVMVYLWSRRA